MRDIARIPRVVRLAVSVVIIAALVKSRSLFVRKTSPRPSSRAQVS